MNHQRNRKTRRKKRKMQKPMRTKTSQTVQIPEGGMVMYDDALRAKLSDFSFRQNEKFLYEYDLNVPWQHVIRVEKILPLDNVLVAFAL